MFTDCSLYLLFGLMRPKQSDFLGITGKLVGCLKTEGKPLKRGMIDNSHHRLQADAPLRDSLMPVFVTGEWIFAVV